MTKVVVVVTADLVPWFHQKLICCFKTLKWLVFIPDLKGLKIGVFCLPSFVVLLRLS